MTIPLESPPAQPGKAWVTLLTNPEYVATTLAMYRTLESVSAYPLIIMATDTLPDWARKALSLRGLRIIDVPHLSPAQGQHSGFDPSFARFNDAWTKMRVFGLTEFERLILIDSDMVFLRGMDELFDYKLPGRDWIGAAPACVCNPFKIAHYPDDWIPANCNLSKQTKDTTLDSPPIPSIDGPRTSHLLNSGLVILHPSDSLMQELVDFLHSSPTVASSRFADQDIIAGVFRGRWRPLPWWTNALKPGRAVHPDMWDDSQVRLIHYILDKPWQRPPPAFARLIQDDPIIPSKSAEGRRSLPNRLQRMVTCTPQQTSLRDYEGVHSWWWAAYDEALADLQKHGDECEWEKVDEIVVRSEADSRTTH